MRQSDLLLETARLAIEDGDADRALEAVRQARVLTPLRDELRDLAADAAELRAARIPPPTLMDSRRVQQSQPDLAPSVQLDITKLKSDILSAKSNLETSPAPSRNPKSASAASFAPPQPADMPFPPAKRRSALMDESSAFGDAGPDAVPGANPAAGFSEDDRNPNAAGMPHGSSGRSFANLLAWTAVIGLLGIVGISAIAVVRSGAGRGKDASEISAIEESESVKEANAALENELAEARKELAADPTKALARLEAAQKKFPRSLDSINPVMAEVWFQKGERQKRSESYKNALEAYQKALVIAPTRADVLYASGWSAYMLGRQAQERKRTQTAQDYYRQALMAYEKAISSDPELARAHIGKARVYAAQSLRRQAVACYQEVLSKHPNSPEAREAKKMIQNLTGGGKKS